MSMRLENAPHVTARLHTDSVRSAGTSPDRDSQAEAYMAPTRPQFGTDALSFHRRATTTQGLPGQATARRPRRPWYLDPIALRILAAGVALSLVYWVGGLMLATWLALLLMVGLLLFALGFDPLKGRRSAMPRVRLMPQAAGPAAATGPLR